MNVISQLSLPGIAFLLTLVFGVWLSLSGKPYNGVLFNLHKLIALGGVIAVVIQLSKVLKSVEAPALIIGLLVLAGVCVVALFASGALMSIGKLDHALTLNIHRAVLALLVVAIGTGGYLLGSLL
ncbi:MAG: hypothetical protein AB1894_04755 [Chloroflexota bacterium]